MWLSTAFLNVLDLPAVNRQMYQEVQAKVDNFGVVGLNQASYVKFAISQDAWLLLKYYCVIFHLDKTLNYFYPDPDHF